MRYLIMVVLVLLTACGQKGALYMPEEQQPQTTVSNEQAAQTSEAPL
ncbi:lipoprotein [Bermanella sp. R86510]